jgi:hypothetical protein
MASRPTKSEARRAAGHPVPSLAEKTRTTAQGRGKKCPSYKRLPKEFRRDGFDYKQIARQGDKAIYEQRWTGCPEPSVCYEVIRIRRRNGFQIGEKFIGPYEVYPNSDAWGVDGFTVTDRNTASDRFLRYCWKNQQGEKGGEK